MKTQRLKLPNEDSTGTTFHYNAESSSRRGFSNTDPVNESASLRVTEGRKKKEVSDDRSTKSDLHLPIELVIEILKRLPVKTLARFLCVSKVWSSTIRSRDFKKLFLNESSNRPGHLFFTFNSEQDCFLFSSNETLNPGEHSVATYHLTLSVYGTTIKYSSCVHDLICYGNAIRPEVVVYNSTTKRSFTLPNPEPELPGSFAFRHFLGYDPINAVYKVLCVTTRPRLVFKIITSGNEYEWRMVENTHAYLPYNSQICISGVLYYDAYTDGGSYEVVVMSFDVRSEKFHLIKAPAGDDFPRHSIFALTRYEGKLTIIPSQMSANGSVDLWVLEDTVKHEWSKKTFVLPNSWVSLAQDTYRPSPPHESHDFLNITIDGEFILAPVSACVPPFYVLYYDPKRKSMRKVSIEGIMEHELLQWNNKEVWFLYSIFSSQAESLTFW